MKRIVTLALALIMSFGAFAQNQIKAHRLETKNQENKTEFRLNEIKLDQSQIKKHNISNAKAMSVGIEVGTIGTTSVEATFTPNDEVVEYYYVAADASENGTFAAYLEMLSGWGYTLVDLVLMFADNAATPATTAQTVTLSGDFMTPGVENMIYVAAIDASENVSLFQQSFTAASLGGHGDATVVIDIPEDSITASSFYCSLTPNDQTAYYYYGIFDQSMITESQWNDDSVAAYIMTTGRNYETLSGTIECEPGSTINVYALAFNIDDVASPLLIESITMETLGGEGIAEVAVEVSNVTANSAYLKFTPNAETSYYYYLIASQDELNAEGLTTDEHVKNLLEQEDAKEFFELEGNVSGLIMGTTYKVYALAYNINGEINSIAPAAIFTTESLGGTGLAEVQVNVEVVDGVASVETIKNDQTAYFYYAIYYGIEDYTDDAILEMLAGNASMIKYEDQAAEIDFATSEADLYGVFVVPFNGNNEKGTTVAIRFNAEGLVGLKDINVPTLNVYPNPANSNVTITSSASIDRIEISNILGQKVYEDATIGANQATINVSGLQNGAYFVRVYGDNCMMTRKLIVK